MKEEKKIDFPSFFYFFVDSKNNEKGNSNDRIKLSEWTHYKKRLIETGIIPSNVLIVDFTSKQILLVLRPFSYRNLK